MQNWSQKKGRKTVVCGGGVAMNAKLYKLM